MKEQGEKKERKGKERREGVEGGGHILSSFMILFNTVRKHSELTVEA